MNTDANMAKVFKVPAILCFLLYFMDKYTWLANMHAFIVQHNMWIIWKPILLDKFMIGYYAYITVLTFMSMSMQFAVNYLLI